VETYTLVQNPNDVPVAVTLSYIDAGNTVDATIPANSRQTFCMKDYFGQSGAESGILVECKTAGRKIMAENANYVMMRTFGQETIGAFSDRDDGGLPMSRARAGATGGKSRSTMIREFFLSGRAAR
jgi:hypothetical protein